VCPVGSAFSWLYSFPEKIFSTRTATDHGAGSVTVPGSREERKTTGRAELALTVLPSKVFPLKENIGAHRESCESKGGGRALSS